ncbi:MAG: cytochrome c biogenesis heme-transporting ATPase CcmA [Gammaproteobacteria bacterium]|nr:cytochrome c biogenesis heme-transporting ATPase CcmA [Gammaproteobacteria bacterium]
MSLSASHLECIRDDRVLFHDLSFSLQAGQVLQVEGHNGSGKTSLLRILCGLTLPGEGEVYWNGEDIQTMGPDYCAVMSYIGHAHGVKAELTPQENLAVARALSASPDDISLDDALEQMGLRGFEDVPAGTLSAGQQRRVALARLLVCQTPLWILDEPFTALDKAGIANVERLLNEHALHGGIAVLTSHHNVRCDHTVHMHLANEL